MGEALEEWITTVNEGLPWRDRFGYGQPLAQITRTAARISRLRGG
jgi:hypothetical protein